MGIGENIRLARRERRMTQGELGEKLGLSASAIGMYEQDRRVPDARMLDRLCAALGVDAERLLHGGETASPARDVETLLAGFCEALRGAEPLTYGGSPLAPGMGERLAQAAELAVRLSLAQR